MRQKERYHITGMTCSACSAHVEKAVSQVSGVERVSVNLLTETMDVEYEEGKLSSDEIVGAVEKAGYGASPVNVGGSGAEGVSREASGRQAAREQLARQAKEETTAMKWRLGLSFCFLAPLMYVAMYHMIYGGLGLPMPSFVHKYLHGPENGVSFALTQLLLLLPILYLNRKFFSVGFRSLWHRSPNMDSLIALGAAASVSYGIFALYRIGYGLGHGDMALAQRYSQDLYFESAGTILTLVTLGKYLESRSKKKTGEAISKLMELAPDTAVVLAEDGSEKEIPAEQLREGDIFLVRPGTRIPADGVVLEGVSAVDESAITGESIPAQKKEKDRVISATMNKAGFLKCRAEKVGGDTTLAQMIRLVEEASASKAPIARLADQVAGIFVPAVIGIAAVTLLVWLLLGAEAEFAISCAIAVLVISCPCALGLATPVAIMVGTGVGASQGILIKSGEALQQARDIDTVVVDKTGTLTQGKLRVTQAVTWSTDVSLEALAQVAAALEKKSGHPLAEAVLQYAREQNVQIPDVRDFKEVFGRGVEGVLESDVVSGDAPFVPKDGPTSVFAAWKEPDGTSKVVQGRSLEEVEEALSAAGADGVRMSFLGTAPAAKAGDRCFVGNLAYLEENGVPVEAQVKEALEQAAREGETPLLVAREGRLLGMFGLSDVVRESSLQAIQDFKKMGIHVVMLTGDNAHTAQVVQKRLGIGEVMAQVLPQDKEKKVRQLKAQGHKVAMVGDGINDAPALAAADVGMAIGAGTDVAIESADIVLMKNDLRDAVTAVRLSRAVIRNIKQNLFWAFFYNCIGIPLAAGCYYPLFGIRLNPMFGAAAMSLSSVFVVANALRLKGFRAQKKDGGERPAERKEKNMTKVLTIEGMMCAHCTGRVQKALEAVEGVSAVAMDLEKKTASVTLSGEVSDEALKKAVDEAGYQVTDIR